ncbi:MAG: diacylglycerol kinase family protein [Leifsonia sp.]
MSSPEHRTRRAAVIVNPTKVDPAALRAVVARHSDWHGWADPLWLETTVEDPGGVVAARAVEAGVTVVLAAGGDGTVRAVASALRGTGIPLTLVPSGTGNLLARNLELTLTNVEQAVTAVFTGMDRRIDVGVISVTRADDTVEEKVFLVMAGLGIDAKMIANTDDDLKAKAGWLAYVKAIALVFRDKNDLNFRYKLDQHRERHVRAHSIMIGNCGSLPANILLMPDAAVDDGVFDVLVLSPKSVFGWVQIFGKVFWENGVLSRTKAGRKLPTKDVDALKYTTGTTLALRLNRPEEIELDGDGFGKATAFKTWLEPGALTVRVPADA